MSCFVCDDKHFAFIVKSAIEHKFLDAKLEPLVAGIKPSGEWQKVSAIINMLKKENVRSVNYRYNERKQARGVSLLEIENCQPGSKIALFKAIQCLDYQSCERNDWEESDACKWLRDLEAKIVLSVAKKPISTHEFYKRVSNGEEYQAAAWEVR